MTRLYTLSLSWCLLSGFYLNAQKIDDAMASEAAALRKVFSDEDVAALNATSTYTFSIDAGSQALTARVYEAEQYIALRPNATLVRRSHYNDKSHIESYSLKSEKGKKLVHDKFCGHYRQGDIFYSDAQICAYHVKLDLTGRSAFFESTTVYTDVRYLTHVFFHEAVPARERTLVINIPEWADIELREMNFEGFDIVKKVARENGVATHTYRIENIKSVPEVKNQPGYLHFLPCVLILTRSYRQQGKEIPVLSSTADLYKWYASIASKVKNNYDALRPLVTELTKDRPTDLDKIRAIYYWVQDNIQYIAFEDGLAAFKPEDAHEVFYKRYGDCKGMANLTKDMLTIAGFDARLTWIGTNRIPYNHDVPSLGVDNHMVCTVFMGKDFYVLDATEKYSPLGVYAERIQGKEILIENGDSFMLKHVPEEPLKNYLQESLWQYRLEDNTLKGTGKTTVNGELKKVLINLAQGVKDEDRDTFLKRVVSGAANPDEFTIRERPKFDRDEVLNTSFAMDLKNNAYAFEGELYLDLDFEDSYKGGQIDKDRRVPYNFGSKSFKKVTAELTIPAEYTLQHLPEAFQFSNDYFSFSANYRQTGHKVVYSREIRILKDMLPVSEFGNWNEAIEGMNKFYNDQIILKAK